MNKSIMVLLSLFLLALGALAIFVVSERTSANGISESTLLLINSIKNEEVMWDLNYLGLMPELTGTALELEDSHEDINPLLVDALVDEDKFVAAHVLLTFRTSKIDTLTAREWNGLEVQVSSNGEVTFEGNDLRELQKRWKERLHSK